MEEASRAAISHGPMRQKNQAKLNLGAGAAGEARNAATQESEIRAAKACLERPAAAGSWWTSIWKNSSIESITTS
jgi:hypothetical protein